MQLAGKPKLKLTTGKQLPAMDSFDFDSEPYTSPYVIFYAQSKWERLI